MYKLFILCAVLVFLNGCATQKLWKLNDNLNTCEIKADSNASLFFPKDKSAYYGIAVKFDYNDNSSFAGTCRHNNDFRYPPYLSGRIYFQNIFRKKNNDIDEFIELNKFRNLLLNKYATNIQDISISISSEHSHSSEFYHTAMAKISINMLIPFDLIQFVKKLPSQNITEPPKNTFILPRKTKHTLLSYLIDESWKKKFGSSFSAAAETVPLAWINRDGRIAEKEWDRIFDEDDYGIILKLKEPRKDIKFIIVDPKIVHYQLYPNEIEVISESLIKVNLWASGHIVNETDYNAIKQDWLLTPCNVTFLAEYGSKYKHSGTVRVLGTPFTVALDIVSAPFIIIGLGMAKMGFFGFIP